MLTDDDGREEVSVAYRGYEDARARRARRGVVGLVVIAGGLGVVDAVRRLLGV